MVEALSASVSFWASKLALVMTDPPSVPGPEY